MLFYIAKKNVKDSAQYIHRKIEGKDVFIFTDGPIDINAIDHIIQIKEWNSENIKNLINNFKKIGIKATIKLSEEDVEINLVGPGIVIKKKYGKDPLDIGDLNSKKFEKIDSFIKIARGPDNFEDAIERFQYFYLVSGGRSIKIDPIDKNSYRSKVKIQEDKIPIQFISEVFLDSFLEKKDIGQLMHLMWINNMAKSENILLRLSDILLKDSSCFLSNLGKKEKENAQNILISFNYVHSKFIKKITHHLVSPRDKIKAIGVTYLMFLGKKSKIKNVFVENFGLDEALLKTVEQDLQSRFINNPLSLSEYMNIEKVLLKYGLRCLKKFVVPFSDEEFDLHFQLELNNKDRFAQEIIFRNIPFSNRKLLHFLSKYDVNIGTVVEEKNINKAKQSLSEISGTDVEISSDLQKGIILTFTGGSKPKSVIPCEQFIKMNPLDGLVISLFQYRKFFLFNNLCKFQLVYPEISMPINDGLGSFAKIKVGVNAEFDYWTLNGFKWSLSSNLGMKVVKLLSFFSNSVEKLSNIMNIDGRISLSKYGFRVSLSTSKSETDLISSLYYGGIFGQDDMGFVTYFNINYDRDILHSKYNQNYSLGTKLSKPIYSPTLNFHNFGIQITGEYNIEYSFLSNYLLLKLFTLVAPVVSNQSITTLSGEYRLPGILFKEKYISNFLAASRFVIMSEIWDSSTVYLKLSVFPSDL